jgi:hypothetical protein
MRVLGSLILSISIREILGMGIRHRREGVAAEESANWQYSWPAHVISGSRYDAEALPTIGETRQTDSNMRLNRSNQ